MSQFIDPTREQFVDPTREQFAGFQAVPRDGVIHMLNLVRFRETAAYPDGRSASGAAAYREYAKLSTPVFTRFGGKQFWLGRFEAMLIGPAEERWDAVFIAEYPSPDAFTAMVRDPEYRAAVVHRQAAVETSRLIRLAPKSAGAGFGESGAL
ncbi:MAG: DUF1330 domain-containing protein [Rhodospirillales bacterium 20-64-7]|nr:MAG: DUF1330 domain-containing protein [Rhodospirillales bacterium 20-64-7]